MPEWSAKVAEVQECLIPDKLRAVVAYCAGGMCGEK